MPKFDDRDKVEDMLKAAQDAEYDRREVLREVDAFLNAPGGQWEPSVISAMSGRPKYTFDKCNDIADDISGEMEQADFDIKVRPAGGDSTKEIAETYDGLIRNIENISNAKSVYNGSGKKVVKLGFGAWRINQEYVDADSFDQDLIIKSIPNSLDCVWFGPFVEPDASDAKYGFVLENMAKETYDERWPDGEGVSIGSNRSESVYYHKPDTVTVGELLYIKYVTRELVRMTNGAVYEDDEKFQSLVDELAAAGITEEKRRKQNKPVVYTRLFDGKNWLTDEQETVFQYIPVIPAFGNFDISEDGKLLYRGAIEKKLDSQRVYNYARSREVEETALAPRAKKWMTADQAMGHAKSLGSMNTNAEPVQLYTHVDGQAPPYETQGPQVNARLQVTSQGALGDLVDFDQMPGQTGGLQSGVALEKRQNKGDTRKYKYFSAMEVAICHTARILIKAIPKVYDAKRQIRVLGEDGTSDMVVLNEPVMDQQTQQWVTLNDLSQGLYDAVCSVGPAFKNRQSEAAEGILEMAAIDPSILQLGGDVLFNNITTPGMDKIAERKRIQLVKSGVIPESQLTDEEKQMVQQMGQQQQPDAMMVAAQAEMQKAEAAMGKVQLTAQTESAKLQLKGQEQQLKSQKAMFEAQQAQQKLFMQEQQMRLSALLSQSELALQEGKDAASIQLMIAQTIKTLADAGAVDAGVQQGAVQFALNAQQQTNAALMT